jgi:hypothetical protein
MDIILKNMPWLDGSMTSPLNEGISFPDPRGRAISAKIASGWGAGDRLEFVRGLMAQEGREPVLSTLEAIALFHHRRYWQALADRNPDHGFGSFKRLLWDPLVPPDFEYSYELSGNEARFCVTRCPHAEAAKASGQDAREIFYRLVCLTDPVSIDAFNPEIGFKRTRTLVQGMDRCDHCYVLPNS